MFPRLLGEVHHSFLGFGPGQIGSAVINTSIGMRDRNGVIHTHKYVLGVLLCLRVIILQC